MGSVHRFAVPRVALFEVRAKGPEGIGSAFFCTLTGSRIVILHAFVKKTEKTPRREIEIALRRMREVKDRS